MASALSEAEAFKMWTVLEENSESEDELDQLTLNRPSHTELVLSPNSSTPASSLWPKDTESKQAPQPLHIDSVSDGHVSSEAKLSDTLSQKTPKDLKTPNLTSEGNSGQPSRSRPIPSGSAQDILINGHHDRDLIKTPASLADALSSAFQNNYEDPYPELTITEGTGLSNVVNQSVDGHAAFGKKSVHVQPPAENIPGARRSRRHPPLISQEAVDEYLDVQVAPITEGEEKKAGNDLEAEKSAEQLEDTVTAFNLRHVLKRVPSLRKPHPKSSSSTRSSYPASSESYTSAYLNRLTEWFGAESVNKATHLEQNPARMHLALQIPNSIHARSPSYGDSEPFDDTPATSATSVDSLERHDLSSSRPSKKRRASDLESTEAKRQKTMSSSNSVAPSSPLSAIPDPNKAEPALLHALALQRLLKGKIGVNKEQFTLTKSYLADLGRDHQTVASTAFEASEPETKEAFLRAISQVLRTADLGLLKRDEKVIKTYAAKVFEKYGAAH
ncbi:hypothetical protein VNI00_004815 [Paramarasmius palmivorus]|uniref:Uncharacterized protein n=1 Tax=Paramarasmius palmivorus TaxID=297713 RepID=A0AAW0DHV6_9AGAR